MDREGLPGMAVGSRQSAVGKGISALNLQTPHSGYHWDGSDRRFFEGWYFRVTLPSEGQSFAFMYSIDDPAGGQPQSGGAAQILGPDEQYFCRTLPDVTGFRAAYDHLSLQHWRSPSNALPFPLPPSPFPSNAEGYQATATLNQGQLKDPVSGQWVRWQYETTPVYGWGNLGESQLATAGWLSYMPFTEPGWQVLMAHGLAKGWVEWQGQRYTFENAPAYAEKNWGGAFPTKWFWLQCNAFEGQPDLTVTSAGGLREVLGRSEAVGLIVVHWCDLIYPFASTHGPFTWEIAPWGSWQLTAHRGLHRIVLSGTTGDPGNLVRVPTRDGLQFLCRDTTHGHLTLQLYERDQLMVEAQSDLAGLEVGGGPWETTWRRS
ncbi:MAG: tocopherol cyclase family protein [Cyanobacteria bacterium J06632_22]